MAIVTETPVRESVGAASRPSTTRTVAWVLSILAGAALVVAGPVMLYMGFDGKSQVRANLAQEHIVTPPDASIPNAKVVDAKTAQAQSDVIWKHMMESSKGKTYAQLDRTDPVRPTLASGDSLRTALLSAVLAWNIANLVIGLGALFTGLGLVFLFIGLALRRPARAATS